MASTNQEPKKGEDQQTKEEEERINLSTEEIGMQRAQAQQNSMEAIRAAEERYNKAKEAGGKGLHETKEAAAHGLGATAAYLSAKGVEAKDTAVEGARVAGGYAAEKAAKVKDVAAEKGQQGYEVAKEYVQVAAGKTKVCTWCVIYYHMSYYMCPVTLICFYNA